MSSSPSPEYGVPRDSAEMPVCKRCSNLITTGHAYELGGDRWHTHCFSCYKCDKPLSCDSDFLVLGTSALICFECSDSCKSCGKKIDDLAIILASSNEAYCSDCFKCCKCGDKINDLRYAKTKKGLFCISCHERLLAKKKYHEEKKRRLKKELPSVPSDDQLLAGMEEILDLVNTTPESDQYSFGKIPGKSVLRNSDKDIILPKEKAFTIPVDFSKGSLLKSSSDNVVAQFLDDEYHNYNSESVISIPNQNSSSQLDKMLQDTLDNSEEDTLRILSPGDVNNGPLSGVFSQANSDELTAQTPISHENRSSIDRTPLRSALRSPPITSFNERSPIMNRHAIIVDNHSEEEISKDSNTVSQSLLSTPRSRLLDESHMKTPSSAFGAVEYHLKGLGISPKSVIQSKPNENSVTNTQKMGNQQAAGDLSATTQDRAKIAQYEGSLSNQSDPNYHRRTSSGAKSLSRSLSMKSKNLISNFRIKSRPSPSPGRAERDSDTHSGWGVQNTKYMQDTKGTTYQERTRISSRGQSDSNILPNVHLPIDTVSSTHVRSQSGSSKVSMFRTPPLDSINTFNHRRSISIDERAHSPIVENQNAEEEGLTPLAMEFFENDVKLISLKLRKLNLEVKELHETKSQLQQDIENLTFEKERLLSDLDSLQQTKKDLKSSATSQESLTDEQFFLDMSPAKAQQNIASNGGTAKPRFWKLFGSGNVSVKQVQNNQGKTLEISAPVLQNPNEFDDRKLLPIQQSDSSELEFRDVNTLGNNGQNLYESSLVARCAFEQRDVPLVVEACISYIESDSEFLESEGLYRKSGSKTMIELIECQFQNGNGFSLESRHADINAVTSVLKRYLRKLPNPLFIYEIYDPLIRLIRDYDLVHEIPLNQFSKQNNLYPEVLENLIKILRALPNEHLKVLHLLCTHLERVRTYQDANLMNLNNLALVFAPGLIKDQKGERDIIDMKEKNYLVGFVFQNYRDIFSRL